MATRANVTKAEKARRVAQVIEWVSVGETYGNIVQKCSEMWGIKERQASNYMKVAHEKMKEQLTQTAETVATEMVAKLRKIHYEGMKPKMRFSKEGKELGPGGPVDINAARLALQDEAKLRGLLKNTIDLTINNERDLSEEDDDKLLTLA